MKEAGLRLFLRSFLASHLSPSLLSLPATAPVFALCSCDRVGNQQRRRESKKEGAVKNIIFFWGVEGSFIIKRLGLSFFSF